MGIQRASRKALLLLLRATIYPCNEIPEPYVIVAPVLPCMDDFPSLTSTTQPVMQDSHIPLVLRATRR